MPSSSSTTPLSSKDLQRIFNALDQNQDGRLSLDELNWLLERTGVVQTTIISPEDFASLVGKEIENGLDFDEFSYLYHHCIWNSSCSKTTTTTTTKTAVLSEREELEEEEDDDEREEKVVAVHNEEEDHYLYQAFKVFDVNDDGFISPEEIEMVLLRLGLWNKNHEMLDFQRIVRAFDTNSDGFVDFQEFKTMMRTGQ